MQAIESTNLLEKSFLRQVFLLQARGKNLMIQQQTANKAETLLRYPCHAAGKAVGR